ncbi:MAG: hypothetical protein K6E78_00415 [Treponema sp.]|nr:hypothetical protein [Treponema sp.]
MKKTLFSSIIIAFGMSFFLHAEGLEFSGDINTKWAASAPWTSEDSRGRLTMGETSLTGKLDAYYGNSSAYAEGTFSYDASTIGQAETSSGNLGNGFNLLLNEVWADYTSSFWGIRVGRQKTEWGKADGIDITNVICPKNMESLSAMTDNSAKLAVDALRLSLTGNSFTVDAYWIPFFTPTSLPLAEGNILRKYLLPSSVDFAIPSYGNISVPVNVNSFEMPEKAVWNGEYGLKASGYFSLMDLSLYAYYGWDDLPFMDYTISYGQPLDPSNPQTALPEALNVSGQYKRFLMFGADAAIPLGQTVLRTEAAFFPQRNIQKSSETILKEKAEGKSDVETSLPLNQLSALAGLDWMPEGWTFTAQYYCDVVFGELDEADRKENYQHGITLSISKSLLNETLDLNLAALLGLNDFDSFIKPSVEYSISDQLNFSAGAFIFIPGVEKDGKEGEGTYGKYKDLTSFYISAKFSF